MLYPKIGIRPVIDGRWGGVRESLENQTMRIPQKYLVVKDILCAKITYIGQIDTPVTY